MTKTMLAFATSAALLGLGGSALAQQGTTLAGPAQGSKTNGTSSTRPSGEGPGPNAGSTMGGGVATPTGGATQRGTAGAATQGDAGTTR